MTGGIVAGVVAVIVAAVLWLVRKAGKDAVKAQVGEQNAKAAERIADARANGPVDLAGVRERVRGGGEL